MNNSKIKTDDKSFRTYLNAISACSLFEHASASMLPDIVIEIILKHEYMYSDCFDLLLLGRKINSKHDKKKFLQAELEIAEEDLIIELMCQLFSKKLMIDTLIEYSDTYAREDIIFNQDCWDGNFISKIDLNDNIYKN